MSPNLTRQIKSLSLQEKILLVEEIWNDISETSGAKELSNAQKKEIDIRIDAMENNPGIGRSWENVKRDVENL